MNDKVEKPDVEPASSNKDSQMLAMIAHLSGIVAGFVGPLVIWAVKKDDDAFVAENAKEALNFQLMIMIGYVISIPLSFVCIGYLTMMLCWLAAVIMGVIGGVAASKGEMYRYPFNLRMVQ